MARKNFHYRISKVKDKEYLQIWLNNEFVLYIGTATKLYKKLVLEKKDKNICKTNN
ncbi:MAG: hypothetical protein IH934_04820 [Nanoarchaeota archaeon]|nr:hypothetical protein [Nanoarchaeota archaeon]